MNLAIQNEALLLKNVDKFLNHADIPWVHLIWDTYYHDTVPQGTALCGSFWWKDICKRLDKFRSVTYVQPNKGDSFLFWSDSWLIGNSTRPLAARFQRLFSFVVDPFCTAQEVFTAFSDDIMLSMFHLPLSAQAYQELISVQSLLLDLDLDHQASDRWVWGKDAKAYTAKRYYTHIQSSITPNPLLKWIWKSCCTMKIKMFSWMLIMDRLNTQDMLERRHWNVFDSNLCYLCHARVKEDRDHLFFTCLFSTRVWNYLQITWQGPSMWSAAVAAKRVFHNPFFAKVVFTACWNIWTIKNAKVFNQEQPKFRKWRSGFIHDISLLAHRIKASFRDDLLKWISFLPP